nr:hypothetical protein Iba_chr11aCG3580 [Ipomoea batatas]
MRLKEGKGGELAAKAKGKRMKKTGRKKEDAIADCRLHIKGYCNRIGRNRCRCRLPEFVQLRRQAPERVGTRNQDPFGSVLDDPFNAVNNSGHGVRDVRVEVREVSGGGDEVDDEAAVPPHRRIYRWLYGSRSRRMGVCRRGKNIVGPIGVRFPVSEREFPNLVDAFEGRKDAGGCSKGYREEKESGY